MKTCRRQTPRPGRQGVTLVEMMIAVAIFGIVMGAVMGFVVETRRSYADTRARAQYQQGLRAVISMVAREVRSAGADPEDVGIMAFGFADVTSLQCSMDLNGDQDATDQDPDETISYVYNAGAGELVRNDGFAAITVLRDLTNLSFRYFDETGAVLGNTPLNAVDRDRIRFVEINFAGETAHGEPVDYSSRIALRNI